MAFVPRICRNSATLLYKSISERVGILPHRGTPRPFAPREFMSLDQAAIAEAALAHTVSDKVEAAYRRGDMREKRRRLMADWADFCASPPTAGRGNVVPLRA